MPVIETEAPPTKPSLDPGAFQRRGSARRKRFLVVALAALAVLAAALGVSFLGSTGTTTTSVTASSSNFVFPVSTGGSVPSAVTTLDHGTVASSGTISAATLPSWSPTVNSAGSVTTAGDLAVIDGTIATNGVVVDVYVTNLAGLQQDYSSYAFPVNVYQCASSCTTTGAWTQATGISSTFLTNTAGVLSFNLPAGKYYDIAMNTGGSFYTTATTSGNLSPSFYFTASPY